MLLDTHTLLWFLTNDPQLPRSLKEQISQQPLIYVSAAVIWEIAIKGSLGKLTLGSKAIHSEDAVKEIIAACDVQEFEFLDVSPAHAALAPFLKGAHRDPFDRLLAAQALNEDLVLISRDEAFDQLSPSIRRLWIDTKMAMSIRKKSPRRGESTSKI